MMRGKWVFPVSLAVLAAYAALYALPGDEWIAPRSAALSAQLSTALTGLTPKLLLAAAILGLTAALGRWYCRLLCPAGIVQEAFSRIGAALGLRRLRYVAAPGKALLLLVVGITSLFGMRALAQITDPLGLFGRLAMPLAQGWRYAVHGEGVPPAPGAALAWCVMLAGAILLVVLPLFKGRLFCDRFCPVGALLGVAARALGRNTLSINKDACVSCGKCEAVCPVQCADAAGKTLAADRCLDCGECARVCRAGAVAAATGKTKERRSFLGSAVAGAAGLFALSRPASAVFARDASPAQITPPGTGGDTRHRQFCVGCQACVAACPMRVLQLRDGSGLRPVIDYDRGFCQYTCRSCADSCPAHAFSHLTLEERQHIRIARVRLDRPRCVVLQNGTACGACAEVCPTHAVQMVPPGENDNTGGATVPDFDPAYCIGCGACYHACPVEPRAFLVEGLARHEPAPGIRPSIAPEVAPPPREQPAPGELTDFPF